MTKKDILAIRLTNQYLSKYSQRSIDELVAWFGAVQSQDFTGAKWAVGQRNENATEKTVEDAFAKGEILRTHVMRPTWHFVHPKDIRWMLKLTAPRVKSLMTYYNRILSLDDAVFHKSQKIIEKVLQSKTALTRNEIVKELKDSGIDGTGQRMGHILMTAELDGVICSGPRKGKQFTYMLLEQRVTQSNMLDHPKALAELTKRYFQSHGPATVKDFVWWSGLTTSDAKKGIELLKPKLQQEQVENETYFFYDITPEKVHEKVYLLPNFDEYAIAYKDRTSIDYPKYGEMENTKGAWLYPHLIVHHGKIIGLWRRAIQKNTISIQTKFFSEDLPADKLLQTEIKRYTTFMNHSVS